MGDLFQHGACDDCGNDHDPLEYCPPPPPVVRNYPAHLVVGSQVQLKHGHAVDDHYSGWITSIDGMNFEIAVIIDHEIVTVHRYATEFEPDERPMCKGSISIGSGCTYCDRCYEQVKEGTRPIPHPNPKAAGLFKRELRTKWSWKLIGDKVCIGMAGNLDTIHDATLVITGGFLHFHDNEAAILLAKHIVEQHNKDIPDA